jgi:hypothetical protein
MITPSSREQGEERLFPFRPTLEEKIGRGERGERRRGEGKDGGKDSFFPSSLTEVPSSASSTWQNS